jgi:hypothetical protein
MAVHLHDVWMRVTSTARNGVVGGDTRLHFIQSGSRVRGRYQGGGVVRGYLSGNLSGSALTFRYVQREGSGEIHSGRSFCEVKRRPDGRLRLIEHFEWRSRAGSGTNVFDETTA